MHRLCAIALVAAVAGVFPVASPASSPSADASPRPEAPAKPAVARIGVIEGGSLAVKRAGTATSVQGIVNAPLLPGDFLSTGAGTQAEVQFDGFIALRVWHDVQARIGAGDASAHRLQLAAGTIEVAVLHAEDAKAIVETPSVTIAATKPGDVRITVEADGTTIATARTGSALLETPQQNYPMESGTTYSANGTAAHPSVSTAGEMAYDAFDDFNADRDTRLLAAIDDGAPVPQSLAGYDDLNKAGRWVAVQPYGAVWVPGNVGSDWAPYRDGQWTWSATYGWTWIANESWGWVPYHYGHWLYDDTYGWCWEPPAYDAAPQWQPAMVGFFGWGNDSSSSFAFGNVGWVPLAPSEPFNPWYGVWTPPVVVVPPVRPSPPPHRIVDPIRTPVPVRSPASMAYRNAAFGGATAVDAQSFRDGNFSSARGVDMARLDNLRIVRAALPIVPSAANEAFAVRPVPVPPARAFAGPAGHVAYPLASRATYAAALAPAIRTPPGAPPHAPAHPPKPAKPLARAAPPTHAAPVPRDSPARPPGR
jgi:hypothetical protein